MHDNNKPVTHPNAMLWILPDTIMSPPSNGSSKIQAYLTAFDVRKRKTKNPRAHQSPSREALYLWTIEGCPSQDRECCDGCLYGVIVSTSRHCLREWRELRRSARGAAPAGFIKRNVKGSFGFIQQYDEKINFALGAVRCCNRSATEIQRRRGGTRCARHCGPHRRRYGGAYQLQLRPRVLAHS
jgi:hypothetical protein